MNRLFLLTRYKYTPSFVNKSNYIKQVPVNYFSIEKEIEENETKFTKFNEKTYVDNSDCKEWNKNVSIEEKKNKELNEFDYDIILGLDFPSSRF